VTHARSDAELLAGVRGVPVARESLELYLSTRIERMRSDLETVSPESLKQLQGGLRELRRIEKALREEA